MRWSEELVSIIASDSYRMRLLAQVRSLDLPDCWIAAGLVRNAVWDRLHNREPLPPDTDIDVIWFSTIEPAHADKVLESRLKDTDASVEWSVKNQYRMNERNGDPPYESAIDAMRYWPETATAVAVRASETGTLEVAAPFGLDDLFGCVLRPGPTFRDERRRVFLERIETKRWLQRWPRLQIVDR